MLRGSQVCSALQAGDACLWSGPLGHPLRSAHPAGALRPVGPQKTPFPFILVIMQKENRVLPQGHKTSQNYFKSDKLLEDYLHAHLPAQVLSEQSDALEQLGRLAAGVMNELSLTADKNGPKLRKRNYLGETINQIDFHPAYEELKAIALHSGMFRLKWAPEFRERYAGQRHRLGFALGYLYAMSESGLYCPLCMTDGVALLIDKYASEEDKARLLPRIYTDEPKDFYTGAMFLTEKAGGSDVGANLVKASPLDNGYWSLEGEKWFCSNASAEIIFALARTGPLEKGTRGLGIFLLEPKRPDGSANKMDLIRLKDKLGTRSMASGEYLLQGSWAKLIGEEGAGFKIMTDMINLSRLYNSVAAISGLRRALIEAYQFATYRNTFGKELLEHALVRMKFWELGSIHQGQFYSCWKAISLLDQGEAGDATAKEWLRFLTPMIKKATAEQGVYVARESMELMGGLGYIEDGVMPKVMRDIMVLPIWEGAGNIMILDMLRASQKSKGLLLLLDFVYEQLKQQRGTDKLRADFALLKQKLFALKEAKDMDQIQLGAKQLFERLTDYFQWACIAEQASLMQTNYQELALRYYEEERLLAPAYREQYLPSREEIAGLLAWEI